MGAWWQVDQDVGQGAEGFCARTRKKLHLYEETGCGTSVKTQLNGNGSVVAISLSMGSAAARKMNGGEMNVEERNDGEEAAAGTATSQKTGVVVTAEVEGPAVCLAAMDGVTTSQSG